MGCSDPISVLPAGPNIYPHLLHSVSQSLKDFCPEDVVEKGVLDDG